MAKRRPSGDGMVRKREDGRWEGRIVIGHKENGDPIFRYIYADTQKELTAKLRQNITAYQGVDLRQPDALSDLPPLRCGAVPMGSGAPQVSTLPVNHAKTASQIKEKNAWR